MWRGWTVFWLVQKPRCPRFIHGEVESLGLSSNWYVLTLICTSIPSNWSFAAFQFWEMTGSNTSIPLDSKRTRRISNPDYTGFIDGRKLVRSTMTPLWLQNTQSRACSESSCRHHQNNGAPNFGSTTHAANQTSTPPCDTRRSSNPQYKHQTSRDPELVAALKKLAPHVCPNIDPALPYDGCKKGTACVYVHPSPSFRRQTCRHFENGRCERQSR